jgi:hypothetical protein
MDKLIVVDNLGCFKNKENSAEILVEIFTKKNITLKLRAYIGNF